MKRRSRGEEGVIYCFHVPVAIVPDGVDGSRISCEVVLLLPAAEMAMCMKATVGWGDIAMVMAEFG